MQKNNKKTTLLLFVSLLALLIVSTQSVGLIYVDDLVFDRDRGPPTTKWYDVEDWEIKFCLKDTGLKAPVESDYGSMDSSTVMIDEERIVALQAEKNTVTVDTGEESITGESSFTTYSIAWYLRPMFDEELNYEIILVQGEGGSEEVVEPGSANYDNPSRGFLAYETEEEYTSIKIKYWSSSGTPEFLEVPIVE